MPEKILILIPPSEKKNQDGLHPPLLSFSTKTNPILEKLVNYSGDWRKLLGVKNDNLKIAIQANQEILKAPTLPAIERYQGVVYDGFDYPSLNKEAQIFCHKHVRIMSAAFGPISPTELIPNYKLKIDKLGATDFWKDETKDLFKEYFIFDLLPQAHQKAVDYKKGIKISFTIKKEGKFYPAGHNGKWIKGRFLRWLCEKKVTNPKQFSDFSEDNYRWNKNGFYKEL